jgi:hypothetical protein
VCHALVLICWSELQLVHVQDFGHEFFGGVGISTNTSLVPALRADTEYGTM